MPVEEQRAIADGASAAILLMLLEDDEASELLRHLDPDEVRQLGSDMFAAAEADEQAVGRALSRFVDGSREVSALAPGAERKIRTVMSGALGNVRADNLLTTIAPQKSGQTLEQLRWMDATIIARIVGAEHPQVSAVIVAALSPEVAAMALANLEPARQADILYRAARLRPLRAEAVEDLEQLLAAAEADGERAATIELGGEGDIARIVNSMSKPEGENLLRLMRKRDKTLAQAIEDEMFVFEDLNQLDAKALGSVLRGVEASTLALALRGAESALVDRFLATMSARAADSIRDELEESGPVKREEIDAARKSIVAIARAMAASGEIMLGGKGDDYV